MGVSLEDFVFTMVFILGLGIAMCISILRETIPRNKNKCPVSKDVNKCLHHGCKYYKLKGEDAINGCPGAYRCILGINKEE